MNSVRLELVKRCIIHSFPRHSARCWQLHLALSHTLYATVCWPSQERCSCADFCLQHCNKSNSSRTWGSTVGLLRAVPTYLTPIPIQSCLARFLPPRWYQQLPQWCAPPQFGGGEGKQAESSSACSPCAELRVCSHPFPRDQHQGEGRMHTSCPRP